MDILKIEKGINSKSYLRRIEGYSNLNRYDRAIQRKYLQRGIEDRHYQVRAKVADFMGKAKDPFYVSFLLDLLKDENYIVRFSAADSLGFYSEERVLIEKALIKALKDSNRVVKMCVAEALGDIRSTKALPYLKKMAELDPGIGVRSMAIDAIGYIGQKVRCKSYINWLQKSLMVENNELKVVILVALIEMGRQQYFDDLVEFLKCRGCGIRLKVINKLFSVVADQVGCQKVLGVLRTHKKIEKQLDCIKALNKGIRFLINKCL